MGLLRGVPNLGFIIQSLAAMKELTMISAAIIANPLKK